MDNRPIQKRGGYQPTAYGPPPTQGPVIDKEPPSAILEDMSTGVFDFEAFLALTRRVAELEETVNKLQEQLRIAANYKNEDLGTRVDGVQFALGKAATVKARDRGRRR